MSSTYTSIFISEEQAEKIAKELYCINSKAQKLDGELDFNFKLKSDERNYLLKVSRPNINIDDAEFQTALLNHVSNKNQFDSPECIQDKNGLLITEFIDKNGEKRIVRLLSWMEGRLWSSVSPIKNDLLFDLGCKAGILTKSLQEFSHPFGDRYLVWDIKNALWCKDELTVFSGREREILSAILNRFEQEQNAYSKLRESIIHSDVNDNNIVVSNDLKNPKVNSIIDYGDAVRTKTINDLAILLAYAIMHKNVPLESAIEVVKGYHSSFKLQKKELAHLHTLVAMRLTITVTKSALNKIAEPENEYHQISEKPAWEALKKWVEIHPNYAELAFLKACNLHSEFKSEQNYNSKDIFKDIAFEHILQIDMSVESTFIGSKYEYEDIELSEFKLNRLQKENPNKLIAGGYNEIRPFYTTEAYKRDGNSGNEHRTAHLGVDFWVNANESIYAFEKGIVFSIYNNNIHQDYGPTLILEHQIEHQKIYSLYGHLSLNSLGLFKVGDTIEKGDLIGYIGDKNENGGWVPHLHFQLITDMLDFENNYPGVAFPSEIEIWNLLSPNPGKLFNDLNIETKTTSKNDILKYRQAHLGKGLSVSYNDPLKMVRGEGVYLINSLGQKYLDTVNNVAHVGHEHERVVKAAKNQISLLNTNTRYLHENINKFAEELLSTFPEELSVVHFVNSGSEANELAMRMCKTYSGQKDMIALEIGYHGNSQGCIDVSSYKFDGKGGKGAPETTHIVPLPDRFRGIYQGEENANKYADHVQKQIDIIKAKGRNVAGFICESIVSCGGQIELPENYLKTAYNAVRAEGGLCIADEVQTGVGRVGDHFWAFEYQNVIPDIVTIGKPIGNGHPVAAVVCTQKVANAFNNGMEYFNTFGGNPVSCAIGREVLRVVKDEKLQENALNVGEFIKEQLKEISRTYTQIQDVRGKGLFLGFEFVDENKNPLADKASYMANRMKDFKILMSTDGKDHNAIKIKPPVVFSMENARELIGRLKQVLQEDFMLA